MDARHGDAQTEQRGLGLLGVGLEAGELEQRADQHELDAERRLLRKGPGRAESSARIRTGKKNYGTAFTDQPGNGEPVAICQMK